MATKKTPTYEASLKLLGRTYKGKGSTAIGAISSIQARNLKGVGVLTLTKGGEQREKILSTLQVSRLFSSSPVIREFALKNLSLLLDI